MTVPVSPLRPAPTSQLGASSLGAIDAAVVCLALLIAAPWLVPWDRSLLIVLAVAASVAIFMVVRAAFARVRSRPADLRTRVLVGLMVTGNLASTAVLYLGIQRMAL